MSLLPPYKNTLWAERHAEGWDGTTQEYPPGPFGLLYRCHHCRKVYGSRSGARKHEGQTGHVVLRIDWLRNDYWPHVLAARASATGGTKALSLLPDGAVPNGQTLTSWEVARTQETRE